MAALRCLEPPGVAALQAGRLPAPSHPGGTQLLPKVQALLNNNTLPLYITGHGKGGAMASLAAVRFATFENIQPTGIYTFASPMPGDDVFANAYPFNGIHTRYEYQDDIVPLRRRVHDGHQPHGCLHRVPDDGHRPAHGEAGVRTCPPGAPSV